MSRGTAKEEKLAVKVKPELSDPEIKIKPEIDIKDEKKIVIKNEFGVPIKTEVKRELLSDEDFLKDRIPHWNKMCLDFQVAKRTWTPTRPCCLPNGFLLIRTPPLRSRLIPCYARIEDEGRALLRNFVEDEELYVKMYRGLICNSFN